MTSDRPSSPDAGFTLLELMVVIFIIGLMASVVVISLPDPRPSLSDEAERTSRIMQMASREAIASGEPVGWRAGQAGHEFRRYRFGKWEPFDTGPLAQRQHLAFGEGVTVVVPRASGANNPRRAADRETRKEIAVFQPAIVFFPSGETSGASLVVRGSDDEHVLTIDSAAKVSLLRDSRG